MPSCADISDSSYGFMRQSCAVGRTVAKALRAKAVRMFQTLPMALRDKAVQTFGR